MYSDLDILKEASLGLHEDWFWVSETVWRDGEFIKELYLESDMTDKVREFETEYSGSFSPGVTLINQIRATFPIISKYNHLLIGGVYGSDWATPVLQLTLKDGTSKIFNCNTGDFSLDVLQRVEISFRANAGVCSSPINEERVGMLVEDFLEKD